MKKIVWVSILLAVGTLLIFICGIVGDIHFWQAAYKAHPDEPGHGVPFISVIGVFIAFIYANIMGCVLAFTIVNFVKKRRKEQREKIENLEN